MVKGEIGHLVGKGGGGHFLEDLAKAKTWVEVKNGDARSGDHWHNLDLSRLVSGLWS